MKKKFSWEDLKKINHTGIKDIVAPDYIFNKWIFRGALLLCLLLAIFIMAQNNFDFNTKIYFNCPSNGGICENPFYYKNYELLGSIDDVMDRAKAMDKCPDFDLCLIKNFYPGQSYGTPPSWLLKNFGLIVLGIWIVAFAYNHGAYNEKKKRIVEDPRRIK